MIVKVFSDLSKQKRGYQGAAIELPANPYQISDVLERARVPEGGGYTLDQFEDCSEALRSVLMLCMEKTLEEVIVLAQRICQMDDSERDLYEG